MFTVFMKKVKDTAHAMTTVRRTVQENHILQNAGMDVSSGNLLTNLRPNLQSRQEIDDCELDFYYT